MPSFKISQLTELTTAEDADFFEIVDDSELTVSNKNKRITFDNLKLSIYSDARIDTAFPAWNVATTYDSANNSQYVSYQSRLYQFTKSSGTDTGTTPGTDVTVWDAVGGVHFFAPPATDTEAAAKTATNRYLTPANLAASGVVDTLYTIDGSLTSNRVVTLGANNLDINLDSTGVFAIQDGGTDVFDVNASGQVNIGNSELYFGGTKFLYEDIPGGGDAYAVGLGRIAASTGANFIAIGYNAQVTQQYGVSIGREAGNTSGTVSYGAVSLGWRANWGSSNIGQVSIGIGLRALSSGFSSVAIGSDASTSNNYGIAIGDSSDAQNTYGIAIGANTTVSGNYGIAIGFRAEAGANELVIGDANGSASVKDFYYGNGKESSVASSTTFQNNNITSGTTNTASGTFTIQTGQSTGSADGGDLIFKVSEGGASGTAQNTQSTVFELGASKIGMYGVTPTTRATTGIGAATFTANTSGIADDTATWGGYTIGQVVQALQTIGVLT